MSDSYESLQTLKGREGIRAVPGMYIDELGSKGHQHLAIEAIDNSVDEALGGYASHITVTLGADDSVTVEDDGRGIPVGLNPEGVSYLVKAFDIHSGGKFASQDGSRAYKRSGGLHGVGIAIIAAMSDRAEATVYRDGTQTTVQFQRGKYGVFAGEGKDAPFEEQPDTFLQQVPDTRPEREKKARPTGTTIRYWVDHIIMDADMNDAGDLLPATIDADAMKELFYDKTRLVPGLSMSLVDERHGETTQFSSPDGITGIIRDLSTAKLLHEPISFSGESDYTTRGEEKTLAVDIAFAWENSPHTAKRAYTNIIRNRSGGTHENGFLKGLEKVIQEQVEAYGVRKAKDPIPQIEDITEGLIYVVSASLDRPVFAGQTKDRLAEAPVTTGVRNIVDENLTRWFNTRANKTAGKAILDKVVSAARSRRARESKFSIKDALSEEATQSVFGTKPEKLYDCAKKGAGEGSELFIVEGDSALGSLLTARSAQFQALFPLRGKPLNVYGVPDATLFIPPEVVAPKSEAERKQNAKRKKFVSEGRLLLQNRELDDLVKIIGAGFGSEFDLSKRNYDRVCLAVDADVDGAHIAALMLTFFFTYMRPLVTEGHLYMTEPPLFVIHHKNGVSYAADIYERDQILQELKAHKTKIESVGRRKGLGESPVQEMRETLMDPATRSLKQVQLADIHEAADLLDLVFSKDTQRRKDWMGSGRVRSLLATNSSPL